tara:strand:+ start:3764 stop:4186 length:423 start_codon:yes stop_codon:yes gene_type:complete
MSIKNSTKANLLAKYANKEPNPFIQLDGFNEDGEVDLMRPDEDGYCLTGGSTYELMTTCPEVRVLIKPKTDKKTLVALLSKITNWVKRDFEELDVFAKADFDKKKKEEKLGSLSNVVAQLELSPDDLREYAGYLESKEPF